MTAPIIEDLEMWLQQGDKRVHISGGELEGAEGITLATTAMGTAFEDVFEAPFEAIYNSTAFQKGGTYGGLREGMFEFSFAFHIFDTPDRPWRINWSRFRKMFSAKKPTELHVKIVGESHRWLSIRLQKTSKLKVEVDPNKLRYGMVMLHMVGAFPRWIEEDWTWSYTTTTDTRVSGSEVGSVRVANQTNCEQWIKWTCQAGNEGVIYTLPDFSFGDDRWDNAEDDEDRMIEMPDLYLDEHIVIDTDEFTIAGQVVSSLDTQVYQRMNGREFLYPLPAYTDPIDLPILIEGADIGNVIQVRVPRTWTHPWGME